MKDYALELAAAVRGTDAKRNILREYLQAYLLRLAHDSGLFRQAAFVGGTALRFLHGLPRFSEDIDLSLVEKKGFSLERLVQKFEKDLVLAGYKVSASAKAEKTVEKAMMRFEELPYESGISPLRSEKLSIRLEIDMNPPSGAVLKTEVVHKFFPIALLTYDLASLFAGKLTAILTRPYTKGRDFYDLAWYLSRWKDLAPNGTLLRHGLKQAEWNRPYPTARNWREFFAEIVQKTDWRRIEADVGRFLDRPSDMKIFTKENVLKLLQ